MARVLTRPMFRKGGLSRETGIMSGLDRKGYAQGSYAPRVRYQTGSWYKPWTWGRKPPLTGGSPRVPALYKKPLESRAWKGIKSLVKRGWGMFPEEGLISKASRVAPVATGTAATVGPLAAYVYGAKKLQESLPEQLKGEGGIYDTTGGWGAMGAGADIPPEVDEILRGAEIDIQGKPLKEPKEKIDPLDETGGEKNLTGDMESDLMRAYKEYAPIFEKELGVSPEDTKKQLWMQLAKFGTGLMAQPGGDLVGAIGRAAEKPLEGAGEVVKDVSTAKRQAKLLALQTAISENKPGSIGTALKDIAKAYNFTGKDKLEKAAAIYEKWQRSDTTARSAVNKRYGEQAGKLGLVKDNQNRFIVEANQLETDHPELIGQFNNKLPEDPDDREIGGYYVTDTGRFVRVVEQDGKKVSIGMDEPGFSDKKKNKKQEVNHAFNR